MSRASEPQSPPVMLPPRSSMAGSGWTGAGTSSTTVRHAGAMLQARQLGTELIVGIHSDEAILENKGPTVMTLQERIAAVDACRWVTASVPYAPYVTSLPWISHYGCKYVVHGDDITSDSAGEDCYRFVKAAGRFKVVKRTPSISTTDLVGRMLLCTRTHFIKSLTNLLEGSEGSGSDAERAAEGKAMTERMRLYATDATGLNPGADVWFWAASATAREDNTEEEKGTFSSLCAGRKPQPGQRVVYVDGGFDLFSSGHIEFLRRVIDAEEALGREEGWYSEQGVNYPIMNIYERGLCVLQCKYVDAVVFGAPFTPSAAYLTSMPWGTPDAVYHGPTSFMPLTYDPYAAAKEMGVYREIGEHVFQHVNAGEIVERIMRSRERYEARQRAKGEKAVGEKAQREREVLEEEQRVREAERE
ncbi:choline phosphate cytidylyltransferase [Pseudogymnoascus australis]